MIWIYGAANLLLWGTSVTSAVDPDGKPLPKIDPDLLTSMFKAEHGREPQIGDQLAVFCWTKKTHRLYKVLDIPCPCEWKRIFDYI